MKLPTAYDPLKQFKRNYEWMQKIWSPTIPKSPMLSRELDCSKEICDNLSKEWRELQEALRPPKVHTSSAILNQISGNTALLRENSATKLLNRVSKQTTIKQIW